MSIRDFLQLVPGVLLCGLLVFSACGDRDPSPPVNNIVAKVSDSDITLRELRESFYLAPNYPLRVSIQEARAYQLKYLIQQRFYYLAARQAGLHNDPLIAKRLTFIENREILKFYIKENFIEEVAISDLDIVRGLAKLKRQLRVQHLFAPDSAAMVAIQMRLENGETFAEIAGDTHRDEYLRDNGGDLGFITFGDLEEALEETVYNLEPNIVSPIVRTSYGYHIVKVTESQQDPALNAMTTAMQMDMVRDRISNRKIDRVIREDLQNLGGGKQIAINNRLLDIVWQAINTALVEKYRQPGPFVAPINNGEISTISVSLEEVLNQVIARFDGFELQVGDLLDRVRIMPPLQRPYLRSKSNIAQFIIDDFRRSLLLQQAHDEGYNKKAQVQSEIDYHSTQVLSYEAQKRLRSEIYKSAFPDEWEALDRAWKEVKSRAPVKEFPARLVSDLDNPDSLISKPPIPLQVQNRYRW